MCPLVEPHHCFKVVKYKYHQSCAREKVLDPPVGSLPLPRWTRGSLSVPCRPGTPCTRLKSSPTTPDSAPGREGLWCHRVAPQLQTCSWCQRALASPCAPWHGARHPTGKGSTVVMCPAALAPSPGAGGLWRHHVSCATGPTTRQGRAPVSPYVPWLQAHLLVWDVRK
jgi:hypothetical protein